MPGLPSRDARVVPLLTPDRVETAVAAGEQGRQVVGVGAVTLLFRTVDEQRADLLDGRAAEGVAEDVDLLVGPFLTEVFQDTGVLSSIPGMTVLLRVDFSVVDTAAEQVGPEDTGAVPAAVDRTEGRAVHLDALVPKVFAEVLLVGQSEVRELLVDEVLLAPAHEAVDDDDRIVVLVLHKNSP